MKLLRGRRSAATLVEVLVASGILAFVMIAVLSFYLQAAAVTAQRDQVSARLRRFHLGLDKIEQSVREGRVAHLSPFRLTVWELDDRPEQDGFPSYRPYPVQFVSRPDGLHRLADREDRVILPFEPGERVLFSWVSENPPQPSLGTLLAIQLIYSGANDGRSDLLFRRTVSLDRIFEGQGASP